jgi:GTP-binding protein
LQRVFLLIDSRRGVGPADHDIMALLDETAVSWALVITKADKQKAESLAKICKEAKAEISKYVAAYPELFITSSEDGTGIETLRAHLSGFALPKADRTTS